MNEKLPDGWEIRESKSHGGKKYYFNKHTKGKSEVTINKNKLVEESKWEAPTAAEEGKIRCSHFLVKHAKSRRPSSWRQVKTNLTSVLIFRILLKSHLMKPWN